MSVYGEVIADLRRLFVDNIEDKLALIKIYYRNRDYEKNNI